MPGKWKSEVYCAFPVTLSGPSTRRVSRPIGDVAGISCVVAMFVPSVESGCNRHLQCVCQTAFGQFDFKPILTLRFGVAHGRFRRFPESAFLCRLADEHGLGFLRAPRFGADTPKSDPSAGDVLARKVDYHCSRGQSELIRGAVAQFEINVLAAGGGREKCYMCDEVARFK